NKEDDLDYQHYLKTLSKNYRAAVQELELSSIFPDLGDLEISDLKIVDQIESFKSDLKHKTYLDEIIFWTIYYEFPNNLITFLLKMLPHDDYKAHFAECFVKHYFRVSMLILHPMQRFSGMTDKDIYHNKLANAIVHISVQLFSNENLSRELNEKFHLLYIIILSLKFAICGNGKNFWGILKVNSELGFNHSNNIEAENNERPMVHHVVSCDHPILRYHRFWPMNSDLNNLFTHKQIAHMFLNENDLIDVWLEFIMAFQAMNLNLKSTKADDTNQNYKRSFSAEVELASSQMWTLISQLDDKETLPLTINFVQHAMKWLRKWLDLISFDINLIDTDRCTFHLPLHRYYSVFLNHAVAKQDANLHELLPNNGEELKNFMAHPLQTLIVSYHVMSNMWFSFGPHIKTQALNYMHPHFCNSKIDADLFLVQQIASKLDPEEFVEMFFRIYGLNEHLNLTPLPENEIDAHRLIIFLENGFGLFATILGVQLNLGLSTSEFTRKEMVAILSVSDKKHSQIQDMMPRRWGMIQNNAFIEILHDIAEYKSPEVEVSGSLVQGYFYPKNEVWQNEYDPLFVLYRNAQRREFQASLERFAAYAKQSNKYESNSLPWPPFRIPPSIDERFIDPRIILRSKTLHAYFFAILYRSLNDTVSITQHLMSIVIHLIELTLIESMKLDSDLCLSDLEKPDNKIIRSVHEFEFSSWYKSPDIFSNFITIIRKSELSLSKNSDQIKTKIIASLFSLLIPDDHFNPFSHLEFDNSPIIAIDNEDDDENVINVNESDNEPGDSNHNSGMPQEDLINSSSATDPNVLVQINPLSIASMLSFYIDGEEIPDVIIHEAKLLHLKTLMNNNTNIENTTTTDSTDEMSSNDSSQPSSLDDSSNRLPNEPSTRLVMVHILLARFIYSCAERLESRHSLPAGSCLNKVIEFVDNTRRSIWPTINKSASPIPTTNVSENNTSDGINPMDIDLDELQRSEKKRKALERKKQIMSKFCLLQNEFIKNNKSTFEKLNAEESEQENSFSCNTTVGSNVDLGSENDPMGNSNQSDNPSTVKYQPKTYQCVICMDSGASILERPFVQMVLLQSSSILNNTFAHTLADEFNSNDLVEYPCPLCRKVANSVLPIIPNLPNFPLVQSRKNDDPNGVAVEILNLLSNCDQARLANTTEDDSKFLKVLAMAIEDVMKATEPQYLPLFHALSLNAKLVLPMYYMKLWAQITGVDADEIGSHLLPYEKQVPLLIKDVSAILLQFLYALPFNIDKALLNLNFIQAIVMMTFLFTPDEKLTMKIRFETKNNGEFNSYLDYIGFIVNSFEASILNSSIFGIDNRKPISKQLILESVSKICLPFLRLAAMIFHLLFNQTSLPEINNLQILDEFTTLADYLCLNSLNSIDTTKSSKSLVDDNDYETFFKAYINWMCNPSSLITTWYSEFDKLIQTNPIAASSLIQENCVISSQPKLLRLPKMYEELF
ncbi:E3 ubiquitin-protein ligase UBR3-like protein, partial [Euroglyphus maynei]